MLKHITVNNKILDDERYEHLFTVEEVNQLVLQGIPFREAYRIVGEKVQSGQFTADKTVNHTHAGSIGNLCTQQIKQKMDAAAAPIQ